MKNTPPSKSNIYFLQQAQWIDAFENMNEALKHLLIAVRTVIPAEEKAKPIEVEIPNAFKNTDKAEEKDDIPEMSRDEIVDLLLQKIAKYPYCLRDRTFGALYDNFKALAKTLFDYTVSMYFKGRLTAGGVDYVDIIVDTLSQGQGVSIQVKGLPGCAKNMLLQLAYYKMLENFRQGKSDYLPLYLSSSYYEKRPYSKENARKDMTDLIGEECKEYFSFVRKTSNLFLKQNLLHHDDITITEHNL